MQVILLERVEKLGHMGDTVNVKAGFARNFLLPQKKALRATKSNQALFDAQRAELEARNLEAKKDAEIVAGKLDGVKAVLVRAAGESGQLYGSVSGRDVAEILGEDGVKVARNQIVLDRPIKTLGLHDVTVRLHPEVSISVVVNVARSAEEAETQFETGTAMLSRDEAFKAEEEALSAEEIFEETDGDTANDSDTDEVEAEIVENSDDAESDKAE